MFSAKHKLPFNGLVKAQAVEEAFGFCQKCMKTNLFIKQSQKVPYFMQNVSLKNI